MSPFAAVLGDALDDLLAIVADTLQTLAKFLKLHITTTMFTLKEHGHGVSAPVPPSINLFTQTSNTNSSAARRLQENE